MTMTLAGHDGARVVVTGSFGWPCPRYGHCWVHFRVLSLLESLQSSLLELANGCCKPPFPSWILHSMVANHVQTFLSYL